MENTIQNKTGNNIPKIIHTIWFGGNIKNDLIKISFNSWQKVLNNYEIKEWTENNFDTNQYPFIKKMLHEKKWAFASDYARLQVLYEFGGIYLDTDMYVLKSFDTFIDKNYELALGKEDEKHISAGMIACTPKNIFIKKCLDYYDTNLQEKEITIPRVLTKVFNEYEKELELGGTKKDASNYVDKNNIKIFEPTYFYPFDANSIKNFKYDTENNTSNAPEESYAVHLWNYSWGHPLVKLVKKIGLHKVIIKILNKLKIKDILKKLLKIT